MKKNDLQIMVDEKLLLSRYCESLEIEISEIDSPKGLSVGKLLKVIEKREKAQVKNDIEEYKKGIESDSFADIHKTNIQQLSVNENTCLKTDLLCDWCKLYYKVKEYNIETMNRSAIHSKVIGTCESMIDLDYDGSYPYLKLLNIYIHYEKSDDYTRIHNKYKSYMQNQKKE
jgi:hypothetical protein